MEIVLPGPAPRRAAAPDRCYAGAARRQPADRRRAPRARRARRSRSATSTGRGAPTASERLDYAIEITYEGLYELAEETLADGASTLLDEHFGVLGGWIASTLVRLGDLRFAFLPAEDGSPD